MRKKIFNFRLPAITFLLVLGLNLSSLRAYSSISQCIIPDELMATGEAGERLVEIEYLTEKFGADYEYDEHENVITICRSHSTIKMQPGNRNFLFNGRQWPEEVPAPVKLVAAGKERLFVPLDVLVTIFGGQIMPVRKGNRLALLVPVEPEVEDSGPVEPTGKPEDEGDRACSETEEKKRPAWRPEKNYSVTGRIGAMMGHTRYRIDFSEYSARLGGTVNSESELEFPLNFVFASLTGSLVTNPGTLSQRTVNVSLGMNLDDPWSEMKDSDWINYDSELDEALILQTSLGKKYRFSYTESTALLKARFIEASISFFLRKTRHYELEALLGCRYQSLAYQIFQLEGFRYYPDLGTGTVIKNGDIPDTSKVIDYKVTYHLPYLGFITRIGFRMDYPLELKVAWSPSVMARDKDDHVLRNILSRGNCRGEAMMLGLKGTWAINDPRKQKNFLLGWECEFLNIDTSGTQADYWYGDNPATAGDDTGNNHTGTHQEIASDQLLLKLSLTRRF